MAMHPSLNPIAVMAEVERLAVSPPWLGFDPRCMPVAIFTGEATLLFRHPNPPAGFTSLPDRPDVAMYHGLHPVVRANTTSDVGGLLTATIRLETTSRRDITDLAGLVIHESFHVFQRLHHPTWQANDLDLLLYPVQDPDVLALRRLEAAALRHALDQSTVHASLAWIVMVLSMRRDRYDLIPPEAVAWERGTELNEGLAQYVERRSVGAPMTGDAVFPAEHFEARAVRAERYAVGEALAILLDRIAAGWKQDLEVTEGSSLDGLLGKAIATHAVDAAAFPIEEREAVLTKAKEDTEELIRGRTARRDDFLAAPGWRIIVCNDTDEPLWPQGFDPLNIQRVSATEVLHDRFLKLGNALGTIEVLDRPSLTKSAGEHPLLGIRRVIVTGLEREPSIERVGRGIAVRASGVDIHLDCAEISTRGQVAYLPFS